jgi:predicted site-specific integrase-resolvase
MKTQDTKTRTTAEAARAARISRASLQAWIRAGHIEAPNVQLIGGKAVRLWAPADIQRIRNFKGTLKTGRPRKDGRR